MNNLCRACLQGLHSPGGALLCFKRTLAVLCLSPGESGAGGHDSRPNVGGNAPYDAWVGLSRLDSNCAC